MWQEIYQSNFRLLQIEGPDRRAADILDKGQCQLWPREIQGSRIFKQTTNIFKRYNYLTEYEALKVVFMINIVLKSVSCKHLKPFVIYVTIEPQCHFALQRSLNLLFFCLANSLFLIQMGHLLCKFYWSARFAYMSVSGFELSFQWPKSLSLSSSKIVDGYPKIKSNYFYWSTEQ